MVSSGTVNSDLSSLGNSLTSYSTHVTELSSVWQGDSFTNLTTQAEKFVSEYKSVIQKQMQAFSAALASYESYKEAKNAIAAAQAALASLEEDDPARGTYYAIINENTAKMEKLKVEINGLLAQASSPKLTATAIGTTETSEHLNIYQSINKSSKGLTNSVTVEEFAPNSSPEVKAALEKALEIAKDDTHGYSQQTRYGNPNYDCSSFVITCWDSVGTGVKDAGAKTTHNMRKAFTQTGLFEWIPVNGKVKIEDLRPGDVLLNEKQHTELYVGNGYMVGAHGDMDHVNGDGSGREISVCRATKMWDGILRYKGTDGTANVDNYTYTI